MHTQTRKSIRTLLAFAAALLLFCTLLLPAAAADDPADAGEIRVPTSAEGLTPGDYYLDLTALDALGESLTQVQREELEQLDWYVDLRFGGSGWLRAEKDGATYNPAFIDLDTVAACFTVYGADWQPVKIVESTDTLLDGDYYVEQDVLLRTAFEVEDPTPAEIADMLSEVGSIYVNTTAPADNLFRYQHRVTLFGEDLQIFYPFADKTWGAVVFETPFFTENIKQWQSAATPDQPDQPDTPDQPDRPDTPDTPTPAADDGLCKWDNVNHGNSLWGRLITALHTLLWHLSQMFRFGSGC